MRIVRITVAVSVLLSALQMTVRPLSASSAPARLVVTASNPAITVGQSVEVTIELHDAQNQVARAPKDYSTYVEVRDQGKAFWHETVTVKKGSDSQRVPIKLDRTGVFMIKASNAELREGATFVSVRPKAGRVGDLGPRFDGARLLDVAWRAPSPPIGDRDGVDLEIRSTDEGSKLTANGSDPAIIQVFLTSEPVNFDITLRFSCPGCQLKPSPLVISGGQMCGETRVTSSESGPHLVELMSADPQRGVNKPRWSRSIQFFRPIGGVLVRPIRTPISLTDPAEDVTIQLKGLDDQPMDPDQEMVVTLGVNGGGEVDKSNVTLKPGHQLDTIKFTPRTRGIAEITALTEGAQGVGDIDIVMPWLALTVIVLGGFLGGLGSRALGKKFDGWRPLIVRGWLGVLAALILYWSIATGLIHISAAAFGTTLFAFLGSLLAGYLGTKVIDAVWGALAPLLSKVTPAAD